MYGMFYVRSARALAPTALGRALPVYADCVATTQRPHASRAVSLFPHRIPAPFDSAVRVSVQPAAQLRYVQGHDHAQHVLRARSARALAPKALSRAVPVHAACVAANQRPHASRAAPLPTSHARLSTRQIASVFNQPLSFDTSKVTEMGYMLAVREPEHPASPVVALPALHARLSTRQEAHLFNQPLSFDTSKVTNMEYMFKVHSARALAPSQP